MAKKKITRFVILQVEGDDPAEVRRVGDQISTLMQSVLKIYSDARAIDVTIAPTVRIHEGNG